MWIFTFTQSNLSSLQPMTYSDLVNAWTQELNIYPSSEAETLVNWLLEHHLGLRRVDMVRFFEKDNLPGELIGDFERLKTGEPIQYILGKGPFYGREFLVSPATLIPRNETEELVHLILKENPHTGLTVMDIGTGTGCIPITLDMEMKEAKVYGVDISDAALEVAQKNNQGLGAKVRFFKCDILTEMPQVPSLDVLVSNPPYVPNSDMAEMHQNVLNHEPHLALFVPDEDPLVFYRIIGEKGKSLLKKGGRLYFEVYEKAAKSIVDLLQKQGYDRVTIHKDLNGKDRMVSAVCP